MDQDGKVSLLESSRVMTVCDLFYSISGLTSVQDIIKYTTIMFWYYY